MVVEKEVTEDVFEERIVKKEVPYVSFDENGDEVTLYRTVDAPEKVKIGTETETQKVVDYTAVDRLREFSYDYLVEELKKVFPEDKIEKLY